VGAFDPAGLTLRATPTAVLDGLAPNETGFAPFAVSTTGALAYLAERSRISEGAFGSLRPRTLVRVDRHGIAAPLNAPSAGYDDPRLSPDGRRLAMTIRNRSGRDVWIYDLARESLTQFTFGGASATAVWTPDGRRLVFWSDDGRRNLFWQPADRSAAAERLLTNPDSQWPASFTPDGRLLTYMQNDANTEGDVWALPFDGDRRPRPVVRLPHTQYGGRLSPDGRWVAYSSDETGRFEIYVTPLSGGGKVQVSTNGGEEAVWARSGRRIVLSKRHQDDDGVGRAG